MHTAHPVTQQLDCKPVGVHLQPDNVKGEVRRLLRAEGVPVCLCVSAGERAGYLPGVGPVPVDGVAV